MSGWRPQKFVSAECFVTLCHVGDEVVLSGDRRRHVAQLTRRVDFFFFVGASRVCSSHSTHDVFSPAWVEVVSSWLGGVWAWPWLCLCGLRPYCIGFSPVFH
jgi:hypothetical protein